MIPTEILNLGAVAIIFLFTIKEYFAYMKAKKIGNGGGSEKYERELKSINQQLGNHLTDVNKSIERVDRDMTEMNRKIGVIGNNVMKLMIGK